MLDLSDPRRFSCPTRDTPEEAQRRRNAAEVAKAFPAAGVHLDFNVKGTAPEPGQSVSGLDLLGPAIRRAASAKSISDFTLLAVAATLHRKSEKAGGQAVRVSALELGRELAITEARADAVVMEAVRQGFVRQESDGRYWSALT